MSAAVFAHTLSVPWPIAGLGPPLVRLPRSPSSNRSNSPLQTGVDARLDGASEAHPLALEGQQILAARRHDPAAFEALVRRHQSGLYNFCLRMLGRGDDAADVAQEAFVQLYSHLDRLG